ncbi:hypothetical protein GCM10017783_26040 [Deinococcus piscis]|uniref:Uncharacterized protein n=1 Tax=Deinococcus piscis TaxID=394230 RepID=A0ABQ3KCC4_9DEIO|nr:hypothetical protein [Deinococcus piscis]GHG12888.1 hypothetical protein GCM10017783_26040 [Deinococcus piscis]
MVFAVWNEVKLKLSPTEEAQLFDIRLHAMEMTDMGGVSLYDPQADEWDFGLEE